MSESIHDHNNNDNNDNNNKTKFNGLSKADKSCYLQNKQTEKRKRQHH